MATPPLPDGSPGTTTTFGSDFSGVTDIDPNWTFLENSPTTPNVESIALTQALARRLSTPRGGLFYDPNYGYDLSGLVGGSTSVPDAIAAIEAECRKDERVDTADASIEVSGSPGEETWRVKISCNANSSKSFQFTLLVSGVTVQLLQSEEQ